MVFSLSYRYHFEEWWYLPWVLLKMQAERCLLCSSFVFVFVFCVCLLFVFVFVFCVFVFVFVCVCCVCVVCLCLLCFVFVVLVFVCRVVCVCVCCVCLCFMLASGIQNVVKWPNVKQISRHFPLSLKSIILASSTHQTQITRLGKQKQTQNKHKTNTQNKQFHSNLLWTINLQVLLSHPFDLNSSHLMVHGLDFGGFELHVLCFFVSLFRLVFWFWIDLGLHVLRLWGLSVFYWRSMLTPEWLIDDWWLMIDDWWLMIDDWWLMMMIDDWWLMIDVKCSMIRTN